MHWDVIKIEHERLQKNILMYNREHWTEKILNQEIQHFDQKTWSRHKQSLVLDQLISNPNFSNNKRKSIIIFRAPKAFGGLKFSERWMNPLALGFGILKKGRKMRRKKRMCSKFLKRDIKGLGCPWKTWVGMCACERGCAVHGSVSQVC